MLEREVKRMRDQTRGQQITTSTLISRWAGGLRSVTDVTRRGDHS